MSEGPFPTQHTYVGPAEDVLVLVGQELRQARQRRGEDLYDVADHLRIKPSYLFALEQGDHASMPAAPYALGFLRSYADHLGLDGQKLARRIKAGRPSAVAKPELHYPLPPTAERRPTLLTAMAALVVVGLGYGGWSYLTGSRTVGEPETVAVAPVLTTDRVPAAQEMASLPAPVSSPAAPTAGSPDLDALVRLDATHSPDAVPPLAGPAAPGGAAVSGQPAAPLPPATGTPQALAATDPAAAVVPGSPVEPAPAAAAVAVDTGRPDPGVGAALAGEARVVLIATETSWIQVRSADRQFSRSRLMQAGEHFPLPDRSDLALSTGNAGGLRVMVDGSQLQPLGARGAVLRNVPLDPSVLKARTTLQ
ncbi:MAG TPA: RodZ domain-containing protein [Geminicoccus sp.]|jgi:cytoskeleton protein RodZ|uniref:helix-turn-helix domain-containing protein n=1 Tax=Geminicoccus sp. TaxID=2024832 RepID=UPI002E377BD9|nr:RodZ domain-containing protein [Geminicoccus sp.]HEX2529336.1 RodZ domain-containing protein [Geminicoccus sp.]